MPNDNTGCSRWALSFITKSWTNRYFAVRLFQFCFPQEKLFKANLAGERFEVKSNYNRKKRKDRKMHQYFQLFTTQTNQNADKLFSEHLSAFANRLQDVFISLIIFSAIIIIGCVVLVFIFFIIAFIWNIIEDLRKKPSNKNAENVKNKIDMLNETDVYLWFANHKKKLNALNTCNTQRLYDDIKRKIKYLKTVNQTETTIYVIKYLEESRLQILNLRNKIIRRFELTNSFERTEEMFQQIQEIHQTCEKLIEEYLIYLEKNEAIDFDKTIEPLIKTLNQLNNAI